MTPVRVLLAAALAPTLSGCLIGTPAADRTVQIRQLQSTGTYAGQFEIDVSQLPPDAVEAHVEHSRTGPRTVLKVRQRYPVKVVTTPDRRLRGDASGDADALASTPLAPVHPDRLHDRRSRNPRRFAVVRSPVTQSAPVCRRASERPSEFALRISRRSVAAPPVLHSPCTHPRVR
jgi:hypothetical protein